MFSGIVRCTGTVKSINKGGVYICCPACLASSLQLGESVSVSGVCLTAAQLEEDGFRADMSVETATCTTLGSLCAGEIVNLERSLAYSDRIEGHFVSGHVDCVATVEALKKVGNSKEICISFDEKFAKFAANKGSVSVNGVSLTINRAALRSFAVMVIPYTLQNTNLCSLHKGSTVNLEFDMLARYLDRIVSLRSTPASRPPT